MEIGLFQLENLIVTPTRFRFFDLRVEAKSIHPGIDRLLKTAIRAKPDDVWELVRNEKLPTDFPLIFICETGDQSKLVVARLESLGHTNVYLIEGGVEGLLSEL